MAGALASKCLLTLRWLHPRPGVSTVDAKQTIELRQKAIKKEMVRLESLEMTPEVRAEIDTYGAEYVANESRAMALMVASDVIVETHDTEHDEYNRMVADANLGQLLLDIYQQRRSDGAIAELQRHHDLSSNQIPLAMLRNTPAEVEQYAAGLSTVATNVQQGQRMIVPGVFATGDASYLMIPQETVPAGDAVFPVIATRPDVGGPHTDSTDVAETKATFTADLLAPGRIQASAKWRRTDATRFPGMSDALRQNINSGLTEKLDKEMIDQIVTDVARTNAIATAETFATYRQRLVYDRLDGRFASQESDLRMLVGYETLSHMSAAYRGNTADDSAVDSLRRISGGVRISPHIDLVATNPANRQDVVIRRGMRQDAVIALWDGPIAIMDEISGSGTGELELTILQQVAWKVIRADGFARVQIRTAV